MLLEGREVHRWPRNPASATLLSARRQSKTVFIIHFFFLSRRFGIHRAAGSTYVSPRAPGYWGSRLSSGNFRDGTGFRSV